jgi:hypothetical protein
MFANLRLRIAAAVSLALGGRKAQAPPRRDAARRSKVRVSGWRLLWDSNNGPAYKVLDPTTHRMIYVPLASVPMNMRRARCHRRKAFTT